MKLPELPSGYEWRVHLEDEYVRVDLIDTTLFGGYHVRASQGWSVASNEYAPSAVRAANRILGRRDAAARLAHEFGAKVTYQ